MATIPIPVPVTHVEIVNSKLIQLGGVNAIVSYDGGGHAMIPINPGGNNRLDVTKYRQISVLISSRNSTARRLRMGVISGHTCCARFNLPLDAEIHTFDVVGPEVEIEINGPKNTQEEIQLMLYLRS